MNESVSELMYHPISYRIRLFQKLCMCFGILFQLAREESTAQIWLRPTCIQSVPEKKEKKKMINQPLLPIFLRCGNMDGICL